MEETYDNWVKINENGFGNNRNRYAWSMASFNSCLYVGTTNDFDGKPYPEIYSYNPKTKEWKKEFKANQRGFRKMIVFNDNLYVGTHKDPPAFRFLLFLFGRWGCKLYRYDGYEWKNVIEQGFGMKNHSIRAMEIYEEQLYIGTSNILYGGQIWRTKNAEKHDWKLINESGFGKRENTGIFSLKTFNGFLWAGTANGINGCEIWKYDGEKWENVIFGGFNSKSNVAAMNMEIFNEKLYVGIFNPKCGCQIWRYPADTPLGWEKVVSDGFYNPENVYVWSMKVYEDNGIKYLYVGTFNGSGYIVKSKGPKGGEMWRSSTGNCNDWQRVVKDGFNDACNYGIRTLEVLEGCLYAGTARPPMPFKKFKKHKPKNCELGCEIWKYPK